MYRTPNDAQISNRSKVRRKDRREAATAGRGASGARPRDSHDGCPVDRVWAVKWMGSTGLDWFCAIHFPREPTILCFLKRSPPEIRWSLPASGSSRVSELHSVLWLFWSQTSFGLPSGRFLVVFGAIGACAFFSQISCWCPVCNAIRKGSQSGCGKLLVLAGRGWSHFVWFLISLWVSAKTQGGNP